jgi:type III secretion system low calcium response chaperone LcrH/SycD
MQNNFEEAIAEIFPRSPQGVSPLSSEEQQEMYALAYKLYHDGNYELASSLFTQLILTTPFNHGFWRGLASCEQMKKDYEASLRAWCLVALLDDEDPLPHFHAAECYLSQENRLEAEKALCAAEKRLKRETEEGKRLAAKIALLKTSNQMG